MVDSKEDYEFDLGVKGLKALHFWFQLYSYLLFNIFLSYLEDCIVMILECHSLSFVFISQWILKFTCCVSFGNCPGNITAFYFIMLFTFLLQHVLNLSFMDAAKGCNKDITTRTKVVCNRCNGKRAEPGTTYSQCPTCKGTGEVRIVHLCCSLLFTLVWDLELFFVL